MSRRFQALLVAVFASGFLSPSFAEDKKAQTIKGWGEVVDPDGDCKIAEEKGKVTITIPGTYHDLNPTAAFDNLSGPRILHEAEGDFLVEVKVLPFPLPKPKTSTKNHSYVGAGLLVWNDGKNFVRLLCAANGESARFFKSGEIYQDGKFVPFGFNEPLEEKATHLRLERKGDTLTYAMSEDGTKWTEDTSAEVKLPKKVKVGVAAVNSVKAEFAPQFENFKLAKK